ncbi:MAG: nicotinamide mononucleotide transporter [Deltaproteobacteria bacterium]|nr:nicotinamide mononucleotide transporter [Deltaproteobacteria bacterium]MCL4873830.1 nicotinamide mononucleotide transporter [bacterium]
MTFLSWIAVALSIGGTFLNARRRVSGFYLWAAANVIWIAVFIEARLWASAFLFAVFLALAVYGAWEWGRGRRGERFGHLGL